LNYNFKIAFLKFSNSLQVSSRQDEVTAGLRTSLTKSLIDIENRFYAESLKFWKFTPFFYIGNRSKYTATSIDVPTQSFFYQSKLSSGFGVKANYKFKQDWVGFSEITMAKSNFIGTSLLMTPIAVDYLINKKRGHFARASLEVHSETTEGTYIVSDRESHLFTAEERDLLFRVWFFYGF